MQDRLEASSHQKTPEGGTTLQSAQGLGVEFYGFR